MGLERVAQWHNDHPGMNNIFDLDPPFVAAASENGYDESAFDIKGRFWYVALKKRF